MPPLNFLPQHTADNWLGADDLPLITRQSLAIKFATNNFCNLLADIYLIYSQDV